MSQVFGVNSLGGFSAAASIDYTLRQRATKTTYFHQSSLGASSFGKHRSDRLLLDKVGRMTTSLNTGGIGETDPVPESTFPIVQGMVITAEFANSVSWTEKLDTFSQFPIGQMVGMVLRQDQIEGLDKVAFAAYALGKTVYTPLTASTGTFATGGVAGAIAGAAMGVPHVRDISDNMRTNAVPPLLDGDYMDICHTDHARGIKDSSEFVEASKYAQPDRLFRSEIGRYGGVRFVEENNVLLSPAGTNTAGFAQGVIIGADNVLEAVAQAPHLRYGIPVDFGRDRREASFYIGGFSLIWRFDSDGGEEHQVRVDSL
jgi:N4-gp56 family major capsid protein